MHNLKPLTPLGNDTPVTEQVGPVCVTEVIGFALASVAARSAGVDETRDVIANLIGCETPGPGRWAGNDIGAFWTGPDQWMITAPDARHEDLAAQIKARAGSGASVTEQSGGWCRFDLTGPGLADVFALLCNLDVPAFKGGEATRCQIEHLGCFVICRSERHICVLAPASSAGSLFHALHTAMTAVL